MTSAGVVPPVGDSRDVDADAFVQRLRVNVAGTFFLAQAALRHMVHAAVWKDHHRRLELRPRGRPGLAAYCASKAAVVGMTKALAAEYGEYGITVNALCPGATATSINAGFRSDPAVQESWRRMTPLRIDGEDHAYIATPEDVAGAALFLASERARFATGSALVIDGGWTAH